jgi:hypothetical protein
MGAVLSFLFLVGLGTHAAQPKEALLIANGKYSHFPSLANPTPDARKLADSLQRIGFRVALVENAGREEMLDALGLFEDRLKASRGIALFHYGGHGVQVNGRNYLIPANADIPDEKRVATRAVELDEVMTALDASGSAANIVILDACRDNPLPASTRSAMRGLSVVQAKPKNSIIMFAAEAGSKAQDGLFTPILADAIIAPGRSITDVFMQVRRRVNEQSGGNQTPGEYNQLFESIILNGDSRSPVVLNSASRASSLPAQPVATPPSSATTGLGLQRAMPSSNVGFEVRDSSSVLESLIREYHRAVQEMDESAVVSCIGSKVDYYTSGTVSKSKVLADVKGDWKRYQQARFEVSDLRVKSSDCATYVLDYTLMEGVRSRRGKLAMSVRTNFEAGQPKIVAIKSEIISAK